MGSAALADAIRNIRDWSMTEGRHAKPPARVSDVFGSLVFNDQVHQSRLPKAVYRALRRCSACRPKESSTHRARP